MPYVLDCPIIIHQEVAAGHCRIGVKSPEIAASARAGQFAMLKTAGGYAPFLRRPMSFERIFPDAVAFLFKIEGEGTRLLAGMSAGQTLSVQGPLGNGFTIDRSYERHIIVAGGIGVAPFPALAETIARECGKAPEVVLAARTRDLLLCEQDFRRMGCGVHLATDDGSAGIRGYATDALSRLAPLPGKTRLYVCGPMAMLTAVARFATNANIDCQVSLEAQMACGDGVCLGCVVESKSEQEGERMVRVCADGPVFDARIIDWDAHNLAYDR